MKIDIFRKKIGHFTVMANERVDRVGCALIKYQQNGYNYIHLVCNYSYNNIWEERVYSPGPPTSACKTGPHSIYQGLCGPTEAVVPFPDIKYIYN